jgi:hypothetical protein
MTGQGVVLQSFPVPASCMIAYLTINVTGVTISVLYCWKVSKIK